MRQIITKLCPDHGSNTEGYLSSTKSNTYPHWLKGSVNPNHSDLNIGVSTVTHTPEGTWKYVIPSIHQHIMKGNVEGMTEDKVVPKTSLNFTTSRLSGTHQAPLSLYQDSYRNSYGEHTRHDAIPRWKSPRGGVNRAKLKFSKIITTTSRVSVRNITETAREGEKQIASK
jgi:hypothetical protein